VEGPGKWSAPGPTLALSRPTGSASSSNTHNQQSDVFYFCTVCCHFSVQRLLLYCNVISFHTSIFYSILGLLVNILVRTTRDLSHISLWLSVSLCFYLQHLSVLTWPWCSGAPVISDLVFEVRPRHRGHIFMALALGPMVLPWT